MTLIAVPRPPKSAHDPNRRISTLLISQIDHLQHAERRLPLRYRTNIYVHAVKTEGEAARYIREVTEAIHRAHDDAAAQRGRDARKGKRGIAAAAAERPGRKRSSGAKAKKKNKAKRERKK
ncbi:MAG: hypothetical protein LAO20_21990 [Acidobacteriia bacterium]|nr:hypothetical protein [Terriglobia bacterium]